jgi:hypothetical protein
MKRAALPVEKVQMSVADPNLFSETFFRCAFWWRVPALYALQPSYLMEALIAALTAVDCSLHVRITSRGVSIGVSTQ